MDDVGLGFVFDLPVQINKRTCVARQGRTANNDDVCSVLGVLCRTWLVDGNRIASKIRSASDPGRMTWNSNPTRSCPNCHHIIDNSDV